MLTALGQWILGSTQWLYVNLYDGPVFFFDLWSLNHACSGLLLFLGLRALGLARAWRWLVAGLLAYEVLELAFIYAAFHAFRPETLKDQLTDVGVGVFGASVGRLFVASRPSPHRSEWAASLLTAVALSFLWVGHYGYTYSWPQLNSAGVNWWAWLCWATALLITLRGELAVARRVASGLGFWLVTYGIYGVCLLAVEFTGYALLGIREVGHPDRQALVADVVHGSTGMHVAYVVAPAVAWLVFRALRGLFVRSVRLDVPGRAPQLLDAQLAPRQSSGLF